MNDISVFLGPTLPHETARQVLPARYLGPASQGDVYRATLDDPWGIVLIDGYFNRVPAVWHKEILFALSRGVHVFGAASMGALRAAELCPFGMRGAGAIFRDFAGGVLEDDDAVAVAHAEEEHGYRNLSEAFVNMSATLRGLAAAGEVSAELLEHLLALAREQHYPDRSFEALFEAARRGGVPEAECERLERCCRERRIDQKRSDALEVLRLVARERLENPAPFRPSFHFEHTDAWEHAIRESAERRSLDGQEGAVVSDVGLGAVLEELSLAGPSVYQSCFAAALSRVLSEHDANRRGFVPAEAELQAALDDLRRRLGLLTPAAFDGWYEEQELTEASLRALLADDARSAWSTAALGEAIRRKLPSVLRSRALWGRLVERARAKERALGRAGLSRPGSAEVELSTEELVRAYFRDIVRSDVPSSLAGYAERAGFSSTDALLTALRREYCFSRHAET